MNTHQSNALWPKGTMGCGNDVTTDEHGSAEAADAVCQRLRTHGFGGDRKVFPIRVWVTELGVSLNHFAVTIELQVDFDGNKEQAKRFYQDIVREYEGTRHHTTELKVTVEEAEKYCRVCGKRMRIDENGVSEHIQSEEEFIDFDHVAIEEVLPDIKFGKPVSKTMFPLVDENGKRNGKVLTLPTKLANKMIAAAAQAEEECSLDELEQFANQTREPGHPDNPVFVDIPLREGETHSAGRQIALPVVRDFSLSAVVKQDTLREIESGFDIQEEGN